MNATQIKEFIFDNCLAHGIASKYAQEGADYAELLVTEHNYTLTKATKEGLKVAQARQDMADNVNREILKSIFTRKTA